MLVIGGTKSKAIANTPILQAYIDAFQNALSAADAKLMVIGYGFRDDHINEAISSATKSGLRLFNISPQGSDAAKASNAGRGGLVQPQNNAIEDAFEASLFGASRRPLAAIFGGDVVEHRKISRFFE